MEIHKKDLGAILKVFLLVRKSIDIFMDVLSLPSLMLSSL
ncbi:hypothetical protein JOC33_003596 [Thalassobacillus pellis]|nr:hypothetical protein [Thalassobacillus pellis]